MAAPSNISVRGTGALDSDVAELRTQLNNTIDALRGIATKLDSDGGVTDTNYFALWLDTGASSGKPRKIDLAGGG